MKRLVSITALALLLQACVTSPATNTPLPENLITIGTIEPRLKGSSFYAGIAQVERCRTDVWGRKIRSGEPITIAVAIRVDGETGTVQQIVTLMPSRQGGPIQWTIGDVKDGIILIDYEAHSRWLDAIDDMREAFQRLNPTIDDDDTRVRIQLAPWFWGEFWPSHGPMGRPHP